MAVRGNIAYDKADKVKWSPDSKGMQIYFLNNKLRNTK